jgi:6-phosphogluconolactonase (cycloisomerase 2 family)
MVWLSSSLPIFLVQLGVASAAAMLTPRQNSTSLTRKLIVGGPGQILAYDYDGQTFTNTANSSAAGTAPSWMIFKQPNRLYAVDENSNSTRLFNLSPLNNSLSAQPVSVVNGSSGVVSLEFNKNKTHLVGTSYSEGQVDVWDVSSPDGSLKLVKQIPLPGPTGPAEIQSVHRAHQAVLDPTGRFFAIADLGGDAIHFIDSASWEINNTIQVEPAGSGPRHGAFIGGDCMTLPSHYVVACELKSLITLFEVEVTGQGQLNLTNPQTLSTFGDAFPPQNTTSAAAGELIAASNERDIYVTNRNTGNETDSISHFVLQDGKLVFADQISSGGVGPRQLSFSKDQSIIFGTNQAGDAGLVAFQRSTEDGTLTLVSSLPNSNFSSSAGSGPQFVQEIPLCSSSGH